MKGPNGMAGQACQGWGAGLAGRPLRRRACVWVSQAVAVGTAPQAPPAPRRTRATCFHFSVCVPTAAERLSLCVSLQFKHERLGCGPGVLPAAQDGCAQHRVLNSLKTWWVFVVVCRDAFHVWPKTTLLPVWRRRQKVRRPCLVSESLL